MIILILDLLKHIHDKQICDFRQLRRTREGMDRNIDMRVYRARGTATWLQMLDRIWPGDAAALMHKFFFYQFGSIPG